VDKTVALIRALATQQKLALQGCYTVLSKGDKRASTGQAYEAYRAICDKEQVHPLTQRRFSDIIGFLDLYGLINARVISKGRYGSTRDISGSLNLEVVRHLLEGKI
jgi:cell division control protein 6